MTPPTEADMLRELCDAIDGEERFAYLEGRARKAFGDMLTRLQSGAQRELTDKQRSWVKGVYEMVSGTPQYENLVSEGKVPRGREVPVPDVLKHLPLKPPGRQ